MVQRKLEGWKTKLGTTKSLTWKKNECKTKKKEIPGKKEKQKLNGKKYQAISYTGSEINFPQTRLNLHHPMAHLLRH